MLLVHFCGVDSHGTACPLNVIASAYVICRDDVLERLQSLLRLRCHGQRQLSAFDCSSIGFKLCEARLLFDGTEYKDTPGNSRALVGSMSISGR